jgi:dTDP-4-amino-4,6-dideoxygalactose transaminase
VRVDFNAPVRSYQCNREEIDAVVSGAMNSGRYILGEEVESLEGRYTQYCGTGYCIGVVSGTDGLLIALRAAGIPAGDPPDSPRILYKTQKITEGSKILMPAVCLSRLMGLFSVWASALYLRGTMIASLLLTGRLQWR